MVDFSKLGTLPREVDYLAYLIDECNLNQWQRTAFPSFMEQLRTKIQWLSPKQSKSLMDAVKEFRLAEDHKDYCARGYADRTDAEVLNNKGTGTSSTKMAQANDEDDMDNDIPF